MTLEQKSRWVAALRSGLYAQTTCALRDKNGYCCLGVYCDISGLGGWTVHNNEFTFGNDEDANSAVVPDYMSHYSLTFVPDLLDRNEFKVEWATLNDENNLSFNQIADLVEYFIEAA